MKHYRRLIFAFFIWMSIGAIALAQSTSKHQKQQWPDLVISNFNVQLDSLNLTPARDSKYAFSAIIKNQGEQSVNVPFYVTVEWYNAQAQRWDRSALSVSTNCIRVGNALAGGGSQNLRSYIVLKNFEVEAPQTRLRLMVDCGCSSEIPKMNFDVKESREDNNYSNEFIIPGRFSPQIGDVTPKICLRAPAQITISGTGFGGSQQSHTVLIRNNSAKTEAQVISWSAGYIKCKIVENSENLPAGTYRLSIADSGTLQTRSNIFSIVVREQTLLHWSEIIAAWKLFEEGDPPVLSLKLNNWNGKNATPENTSTLTLFFKKSTIAIEKIQEHRANLGSYRYLINNLNTRGKHGLRLRRWNCQPNQFLLVADFDSSGRELRGYFQALGGRTGWTDAGAPNIDVNNAQLMVLFNLVSNGGRLDYSVTPSLTADIKASSGNNWILDLFLPQWKNRIVRDVQKEVKKNLEDQVQKADLIASLTEIIDLLSGAPAKQPGRIDSYEFTPEGILITWH